MSVVPSTQEAEAGESREPGGQKLQRAEILPLHSSLGNKSKTPSQKRRRRRKRRRKRRKSKNKTIISRRKEIVMIRVEIKTF